MFQVFHEETFTENPLCTLGAVTLFQGRASGGRNLYSVAGQRDCKASVISSAPKKSRTTSEIFSGMGVRERSRHDSSETQGPRPDVELGALLSKAPIIRHLAENSCSSMTFGLTSSLDGLGPLPGEKGGRSQGNLHDIQGNAGAKPT